MGNHAYLTNEQVKRAGELGIYDMTTFAQQAVSELLAQREAKEKKKGEKE